MNRMIRLVVFSLVVSGVAQAQSWQAVSPDILHSNGAKVGVKVSNPSEALEVDGKIKVTTTGSVGVGGAAPSGYQFFATNNTHGVSTAFQLHSNYAYTSTSFIGNFGRYGTRISHNREPQLGGLTDEATTDPTWAVHIGLGDSFRGRLFHVSNMSGGSETDRILVNTSGNVGIGPGSEAIMSSNPTKRLVVDGDIYVSGNINAKYQDVAEWVPATSDLAPGTVVVLNPARDNEVMASARAYDTTVAGVVSERPGLILGEEAASMEKIATTGRVRVRVDARQAPIAVGDLLVTSDRPGVAMKSIPIAVAGASIHRPGTIVGKALQPLPEGEGEILVLLSLQ